MSRVAVIALGSPFGDDGAGWRVAEALAASPVIMACGPRVAVTACRSPAGDMAAMLAAEQVILVDAVMGGGVPGTVYRYSRPDPALFAGHRLSSHGMGLETAFSLARALGRAPEQWLLYGIEIAAAAAEECLSAAVRRAVPQVVEAIERDIAHFCRWGGCFEG